MIPYFPVGGLRACQLVQKEENWGTPECPSGVAASGDRQTLSVLVLVVLKVHALPLFLRFRLVPLVECDYGFDTAAACSSFLRLTLTAYRRRHLNTFPLPPIYLPLIPPNLASLCLRNSFNNITLAHTWWLRRTTRTRAR